MIFVLLPNLALVEPWITGTFLSLHFSKINFIFSSDPLSKGFTYKFIARIIHTDFCKFKIKDLEHSLSPLTILF
jgi:hypothetical protein